MAETKSAEAKSPEAKSKAPRLSRQHLQRLLKDRTAELTLTNRIADIFLTVADEEMFGQVLQVVLEALESKYGVFGYINEEGALVCPSITRDIWDQCRMPDKDIVFPRETWGGLWGRSLTEKKTLYSNEPFGVPEGHVPVCRALSVPIIHHGNVIGQLLVANKATDYVEEDIRLLETIGDYIAPVLNARLQRDRAERDREQAAEEIARLAKFPSENPNPVLRVAEDGTVLYANAASQPLLDSWKCRQGEVVPDDQNKILAETLACGSTVRVEVQCDDRLIALEYTPVADLGYVNVYGLDITKRKRAEDEKRKLEEKMQQAQKLESLGVLAGGIAHDFNNLLTGVLGVADQASRELPSTSPVQQHFEMIQKSARRAAALCQQMLAYSGKGHFSVRTFRLDKLVEDMAGLLEVSVSKGIDLKRNYAQKVPPIEADVNQVRQIVMNLVTNASEAIGDGGGVVNVSTGVMEADKDYLSTTFLDDGLPEGFYVYVEVADTGCGMDRETQERIFDPFFTTKFTGRGLGLAAVLGIVRGHRGTLTVASRPGQGTTIRVLLPASEKPAEPLEVKPPRAGQSQGEGTILLIDDEEVLREAVKLLFSNSGFTLLTARDGIEGVEVFRQHADEIVAVILDMTMPHMSGKETFAELRHIQPDVKVILISCYAEGEAKRRFEAEGLLGFLQKPFVRDQLMTALEEALNAERA